MMRTPRPPNTRPRAPHRPRARKSLYTHLMVCVEALAGSWVVWGLGVRVFWGSTGATLSVYPAPSDHFGLIGAPGAKGVP